MCAPGPRHVRRRAEYQVDGDFHTDQEDWMARTLSTRATARPGSVTTSGRSALRAAWAGERAAARDARERGDTPGEWKHLERAHILSQPLAGPHVRTHVDMLAYAFRRRDRR